MDTRTSKENYYLDIADAVLERSTCMRRKYGAIIDSAKQFHPDAIIYIESILPVTTTNKYKLDNQTIDEYNEVLMKLAEEKEVYYLDINSSLKNSEGALPTEASPADGMHFGAAYYQKWFDYLKTHTVK